MMRFMMGVGSTVLCVPVAQKSHKYLKPEDVPKTFKGVILAEDTESVTLQFMGCELVMKRTPSARKGRRYSVISYNGILNEDDTNEYNVEVLSLDSE